MRISDAVKAGQPYAAKLANGEIRPQPPPAPLAHPVPPLDPAGGSLNSFMKSPLPRTSMAPDSIKQFYRAGVPQRRVVGLPPLTS